MRNLPNKNEFIRLLGQTYTEDDFTENANYCDDDTYDDGCLNFCEETDINYPDYDEDIDIYTRLVDMFDDDDLWISEWLSCQRQGKVFAYYEPSDTGNEKFTITSAGEFYDFLLKIQEEKKNDAVKERFI